MSKKKTNTMRAHERALRMAKKREILERDYGETLPDELNEFIDKYIDIKNLPRQTTKKYLDYIEKKNRIHGQRKIYIESSDMTRTTWGDESKIERVRLPYTKSGKASNAKALENSIKEAIASAKDAQGSSYLSVLDTLNEQLSILAETSGVDIEFENGDKAVTWDKSKVGKDREIKPEDISINIKINSVDASKSDTRAALQRTHEFVPYAYAPIRKQFTSRSYNTHLDKLAAKYGLDKDDLLELESIMNTSAAWNYAKKSGYDSDQMVDAWREMYVNLADMNDNSSVISDLKSLINKRKGNPDIDISSDFADIVDKRIMAAMKGD